MSKTEAQKFQTDEAVFDIIPNSGGGDIAIIGMECIYAGASDIATFWQNILSKVDCIIDVPSDRWDPETFYDADYSVEDKLHCKRGGYLPGAIPFTPSKYGIMPISVQGVEPDQYITLDLVYNMLEKAGYLPSPLSKGGQGEFSSMERTEIIIGKGNYLSAGHANLVQRRVVTTQTLKIIESMHPEYTQEELDKIKEELHSGLRNFNSETAPSLIPNLTTGRTANRLDFMGANFMLDGACASVLIATDLCVRDLLTGRCDLAIAGGAHVCNDVPLLMLFEAFHAVSPNSQIRPFDKDADGTIPGEGVGVILLKRLEDAERDGDKIYAVIKGVGVSSDGRAMSVTAPRVEGAALAIRRAYEMVNLDPKTIELLEAHGTGTPVGDAAEVEALKQVFGLKEDESMPPWCAMGSVKSMIGHALPGSGAASIIKTALALYHKVLPPTLNCDQPNPKFELEKTPFYINTETRPWIHGSKDVPRRAGVNAFGFGGINSHLILEEYRGSDESERTNYHQKWDTEVFILERDSRDILIREVQKLQQYLKDIPQVALKDLAYTLNTQCEFGKNDRYRLAIIASSAEELSQKLNYALERLSDKQCKQIKDIKGTYFFEKPLYSEGTLAFLFPGEGSQYVNMLGDLCIHFPEVRACFDRTDQTFIAQKRPYLPSQFIFPAPSFTKEERKKAEERLWEMDGAIEAVLTANWALTILLDALEIRPDMIVGHSSGEFSSLLAAGVADADESYFQNLNILNTYYERAAADGAIPSASMIAVGTDVENITTLLHEVEGEFYVAMDNCPHQVVIVGEERAAEQVIELLSNKGIMYEKLKFDRGYHTPMFEEICESLYSYFAHVPMKPPKVELYSCSTMAPFPKDPEKIRKIVVEHWMRPVEFRKTIEAMYDAGARIFVEVGPRGNLIAFVDDILRGRSYLAMPANVSRRSGITQLNHLVGILAAHGVPMKLDYLYARRSPRNLTLTSADASIDEKEQEDNVMLMLDFPIMDISEERKEAAKKRVEESLKQDPIKSSSDASSTDSQPQSSTQVSRSQEIAATSEISSTLSSPSTPGQSAGASTKNVSQPPPISEKVASPSAPSTVSQSQPPERGISQPPPISERTPNPSIASDISGNSSLVMQQYFQTMENFLETQQQVMQAYLTKSAPLSSQRPVISMPQAGQSEIQTTGNPDELATPSETHPVASLQPQVEGGEIPRIGETTISPVEQTANVSSHLDLSASNAQACELSQDPQKTVSVGSSHLEAADFPPSDQSPERLEEVEAKSEDVSPFTKGGFTGVNHVEESTEISIESLKQTLLTLVSEKTGYPPEMLDLNLDMEADLGIDSIKRVEILGAFQEYYAFSQSADTEVDIEQIASLKTLQQVIDFLGEQIGGGNGKGAMGQEGDGARERWDKRATNAAPFIGEITSLTPGEEIVVTRCIDWKNEDIFMEDHTFGPEISNLDPTLKGVPIIPLTVGLEMMCEAASTLMSSKKLVGIKSLRAHQWIQVENPVTLQVIARRQESSSSGDEVKVEIRSLEENLEGPMLMMSVTTVFEDAYPAAPSGPETFPLASERTPQRTAEEIYRTHYMFHGPRFHKMASLDRMGDDGLVGQLKILPTDNLFRSNPNPSFVINPLFMDAIGQLVGYWPFENLKTGYLILPMGIKSVSIYRPDQPVSERFTCYLRIIDITPTFVRANIDVVCPDGRLWMRVEGWEDWRYYFPVELFDFWRFPNKEMISKPFDAMLAQLPEEVSKNLECLRIKHFKELDSTLWETVWAYLILNRHEREKYWSLMKKQGNRRVEWLLGRSAAKDSIRIYIKKRYGIELYPADIGISEDEYGRPAPQGLWTQQIEDIPSVSVTHTRKGALSLAGSGNLMVGIDLETIDQREQGFEKIAFTEAERALLADLGESMREEWMTRFWCAKEAVAKALGRGLMNGPRSLVVKEMNPRTGLVKIAIVGKLADEFPQFANTQITAYTIRDENEIIASAILEKKPNV